MNLGSLPGSPLSYQSSQISSWTSWHTGGLPLRLRCVLCLSGVLCFSFMNWGMAPGITTQSSTQVSFVWPLSISQVFITTLRWVITFSPYCMELWRRKLLELDSWVFRLSNQSEFGFPIYVCLCSVMSDFFATPSARACHAPLSMEFSRQAYWSGFPFPPPGNLSNTGIEPMSSSLQADSLPLHHRGRPFLIYREQIIILPFLCLL